MPQIQEDDEGQESLEEVRRRYLLGRLWLSGKSLWSRDGSKLAWPLSMRPARADRPATHRDPVQLNVWNRRSSTRWRRRTARPSSTSRMLFMPLAAGQHRGRGRGGLGAHAHAAALARLAHRARGRPLARQGPLLPAQPDRGRAQEPGSPHRRGHAHRDRSAGRFRGRHPHRVPHLGDLHRRAVDGRRRLDARLGGTRAHIPGYPGHRGGALLRHHQRR